MDYMKCRSIREKVRGGWTDRQGGAGLAKAGRGEGGRGTGEQGCARVCLAWALGDV